MLVKRTRTPALMVCLVVLLVSPMSSGQTEIFEDAAREKFRFEVDFRDGNTAELPMTPGQAIFRLHVQDRSPEVFPPPSSGVEGSSPQQLAYSIKIEPLVNDSAWTYSAIPPAVNIQGGGSFDTSLQFSVAAPQTSHFTARVNITMTPQVCCGPVSQEYTVQVWTEGPSAAISARAAGGQAFITAQPDDIVQFPVEVLNLGTTDRGVRFDIVDNPCGLSILTPTGHLGAKETGLYHITVHAPNDQLFYYEVTCPFAVAAQAGDGRGERTVNLVLKVNGGYVDPGWVINLFIAAAIIALIVWFILARKRQVEEEILGKPQPPWTLPAEQVYLDRLQEKDPRAAYVVRHFIMEDEYRSSLAWYNAYKRATRGTRSKERLILKQEHQFEKWDAKQERRMEKPTLKAERKVAKLQAKLDKKAAKANKKVHGEWQKEVDKLEAKHHSAMTKLTSAWEKESKRAQRRGESPPPKPKLTPPDLPPEPAQDTVSLGEHKWGQKAARIEEKGLEGQERMIARVEKQRDRRLEKLRRKMAKVAKKLDDPKFVDEHPLLQGA